MKYLEFLEKEVPQNGGCLLCEINDNGRIRYMLIERWEVSNGHIFIANGQMSDAYEFLWNEETPWKILYKKNI